MRNVRIATGWVVVLAVGAVALLTLAAAGLFWTTSKEPRATHEAEATPPSHGAPASSAERLSEALGLFNQGTAHLEQYEEGYSKAARAFERVLQLFPNWTAARFNLGLAYFNLRGENLPKARDAFEQILRDDPKNPYARFCLGLYFEHTSELKNAFDQFRSVYEADPDDRYVAYKYAESLIEQKRYEEAAKVFEKIVAADPGFESGVYRLAMLYLQRLRQPQKAAPLLERYKELTKPEVQLTGHPLTVEMVYGTVGKYYTALDSRGLPLTHPAGRPMPRILFSPQPKEIDVLLKPWKWPGGTVDVPGVAVGDFNGDGKLDLVLTGLGENGGTQVWFNDGKGGFRAGPKLAERGVSPCLGDIDNDGDLDIWLGREGEDLLFLNDGKGNFSKAPVRAAEGPQLTCCARLLDIDSDGDLDLIALRLAAGNVPAGGKLFGAASLVFQNNRDGTYKEIAADLGLAMPATPLAAIVYDDFDNDRDIDLIVLPANSGPIAWVNDRAGKHHLLDAAATGLNVAGAVGATTGDPNKDGRPDLLIFSGDRVRLFLNRGHFQFEEDRAFSERFGNLGGTSGQFVDIDNDGDLDIIIADVHRPGDALGPVLLINDWPRQRFTNAAEVDPGNLLGAIQFRGNASCVAADFNGDGRCDLLLLPSGGKPMLIENATQGGHFIEVDLAGGRDRSKKTRSDNSAIGARVDVKTGTVVQQYTVGAASGALAMPPLRIHAGLGENTNVDWLRVVWPDVVFQSETELAGGQVHQVSEIQRKEVSCPHLFAWNGFRFELVSDFGGMGGLGYLVGPGQYNRPDPTEYVRIPNLKPLGNEYVLQVLEPLEEVTYLDEAKLLAVDHPEGTEVYPNEMMAVSVPPPPFAVFCFKGAIEPMRAVDHRGADVTEALRRIDRQYAGATELDHRFTGFAKEHFVELDFGDRLAKVAPDARLILVLEGSVEYDYSTTTFAAAQAGLRLKAPSVLAQRGDRWVELLHEIGCPAGIQHAMTLDVTGKILPGDGKIRVVSNMELYWDRIYLAEHSHGAKMAIREVPATSADLHFLGYPREYTPDGRKPNLMDYDSLDRSAGWKLMPGDYTRYGEVGELLREADDCFVIMGHGDEVTLRFPVAAFGPVSPGCRRTFLLKTDSYCKDMDLHTAHPDRVEPLPFHAMSGYPYGPGEHYPDTAKAREYRQRFNTRKVRTE